MGPSFADRLWEHGVRFATMERTVDVTRAALIVIAAIVVSRLVKRWVRSLDAIRADAERAIIAGRLTEWTIFFLGLAAAFQELGFKLHVLLGAAGVISIAIGFAAQTTLSNLISGFFLFGERPFGIGDVIEVDTVTGEVLGIGMLATTLRTPDHRFVRIPNEALIKNRVTNTTRFPVRRLELTVPLAHRVDFEPVRAKLLDLAAGNPLCKSDPAPSVFVGSFGETTLVVHVWLWVDTRHLQRLRVEMAEAIQKALLEVRRVA